MNSKTLLEFSQSIKCHECNDCDLREFAWLRKDHNYPVPNDYNPEVHKTIPKLLIVGEALGEAEAREGLPFVGLAGQLLRGCLISNGLNLSDYICTNACMCRPDQNRQPTSKEITSCSKYLHKQIELIQPKCIITLGSVAYKAVTGIKKKFSMRQITKPEFANGLVATFNGHKTPLIPMYHPSYLARKMMNGIIPKDLETHYNYSIRKAISYIS